MKQVIRYEAGDGTIYPTAAEAVARDKLLADIKAAMDPLGPEPTRDQMDRGWIQHRPVAVSTAKRAFLLLIRPLFEKSYPEIIKAIDNDPDSVHPRSFVGRFLSDHGGPLNDAWYRFMVIDDQGREHNQPYHASHGPDPRHVCVEDRR